MTPAHISAGQAPSHEQIRAELERMIASDVFRGSAQLAAFLRFVVEAVLHGKQDRIKAYTIAVEVLRRNVTFDPQIDPIVRVEATRLRRTIERYYAGPGVDDAIIIELPRGTYVPTFRRRGTPAPASPSVPSRAAQWSDPKRMAAAAALMALILGVVVLYGAIERGRSRSAPEPPAATAVVLPPGNGMPTLYLQRIETLGLRNTQTVTAASLLERLRDAFSRFDAINIVANPQFAESLPADTTVLPSAVGSSEYRLLGSIEYLDDQTTTVRFSLQEGRSNTVLWSRAFERLPVDAGASGAAEDSIVLDLAATLLQPFGVIRSHDRIEQLATGTGDPRYRCVIQASEALRSLDLLEARQARACLDRLASMDAQFVTGIRYLAAIDLRDYQFGSAPDRSDAQLLDRALAEARRAVELQPESSRGYNTLASVLFARQEIPQSFAAGDRAIALNRYDMNVLGDYGGRLIASGEIDRGMTLLQRAAGVADVRPSAHHFFLFLGGYLRGDMAAANYHAGQLTNDAYQLGVVAHALAAYRNGDRDAARGFTDRLVQLNPAWRSNLRGNLEKFIVAPKIAERLAGDLQAAGLAPQH
jgi:hypothetical protein